MDVVLETQWETPLHVSLEELTAISDPVCNDETDADHLLCHADNKSTVLWWSDLRLQVYTFLMRARCLE